MDEDFNSTHVLIILSLIYILNLDTKIKYQITDLNYMSYPKPLRIPIRSTTRKIFFNLILRIYK